MALTTLIRKADDACGSASHAGKHLAVSGWRQDNDDSNEDTRMMMLARIGPRGRNKSDKLRDGQERNDPGSKISNTEG